MGKRLLMFIDDLNMPRVDTYGTQQPIALLKLFIERKGLFDRGKELSWKNMKDVQVGGGVWGMGGGGDWLHRCTCVWCGGGGGTDAARTH